MLLQFEVESLILIVYLWNNNHQFEPQYEAKSGDQKSGAGLTLSKTFDLKPQIKHKDAMAMLHSHQSLSAGKVSRNEQDRNRVLSSSLCSDARLC